MSNGVSKRKACQFVGITRRGLDLPLKDKGDPRCQGPEEDFEYGAVLIT